MTLVYPLQWPTGWKRTPAQSQQRAKFSKKDFVYTPYGNDTRSVELTIYDALDRLYRELSMLGAAAAASLVSTNIALRRDGNPRPDRRQPDDIGAAVYFNLHGKDRVLACDKWDRVADNIAAIAAHIDAIRRQDRYGVGTLDQAFAGYSALPPPRGAAPTRPWYEILGLQPNATLTEAEAEYKRRAKTAHPDINGGSGEHMIELNVAIAEVRRSGAA